MADRSSRTVRRLSELVDHGAADASVSEEVISGQLVTAAALHDRLATNGGAILGDEVGAGKTYVAMALIVEALAANPDKGAVILVPKPALAGKWRDDLRLYLRAAVRDPKLRKRLVDSICLIDRGLPRLRKNAIAIGQQNLFMGPVSKWDAAAVLRAYMRERSGRQRLHYRPWLKECGITGPPANEGDWTSAWADAEIFVRRPALLAPLDRFFAAYDNREWIDHGEVMGAVKEIRRRVARQHLPHAVLLVIDEAHHLRNTQTTRYRTMMEVLSERFDALLFLTATPFQMGPAELRNVVEFARNSTRHLSSQNDGAPVDFDTKVNRMAVAMDDHVQTLDSFGRSWSELSAEEAQSAQDFVDEKHGAEELAPHVVHTGRLYLRALESKKAVEEALEPFLVRSVRDHYRDTRAGLIEDTAIEPSSRIPLALVDRMLYEIFERGDRTFIASVLLGACSSWPALNASSVMHAEQESPSREQLRKLAKSFGPHPKVEATKRAVAAAVDAGEKVLIFVERVETGRQLRNEIAESLREPEDTAELRVRGRRALQDHDRLGWPALRENYLHTIYPLVFGTDPDPKELGSLAAEYSAEFQKSDAAAPQGRRDYSIEKRFWEQAYFKRAVQRQPRWEKSVSEPALAESVRRILHRDYVLNGLDLVSGEKGEPRTADGLPPTDREPQMDFAEAYVRYESPWAAHAATLASIAPDHRAEFADAVARAIALSHLRVQFTQLDTDGSAEALLGNVKQVLAQGDWAYRFDTLVEQLAAATRSREDEGDSNEDATRERFNRLLGGLRGASRVQYIDGGADQTTSQNAISGFKTPMYPDVLIATEVLGEGVDLHRNCRRVIHHDLPWNPAKLEQRTGRVDRIGSLSEHLLEEKDPDPNIKVDMPYVPGTYDAFIYSQVTSRERVFRWLLGYRPEWDTVSLEEPPEPVPDAWAERLRIDLSPQ